MGRRLGVKLLLIGGLLLLLLVPLGMLDGLVAERQARGAEVAAEIAASAGSEQVLLGPLLRVDNVYDLRRDKTLTEDGVMRQVSEIETLRDSHWLPPQRLDVDAVLRSERRGRGPFSALIYHSQQTLKARFVVPESPPPLDGSVRAALESLQLILGLSDNRGISAVKISLDGLALEVEPGTGLGWQPNGVRARLPADIRAGQTLELVVELQLSGSRGLAFVPLADENAIALRSDWPHPSFTGAALPQQREISDDGFAARWQVSRLASSAQHALRSCGVRADGCPGLHSSAFAVRLVDPVDRYAMSDRAIKYALLFLLLVFASVFFTEVLSRVAVHAMHYGLVGLALAIFFLLLLALAEHIGFALAYLLAALACGSLIGYYLSAVLGSPARGAAQAGLVFALYGLLYGLLQSEDFALLLGSVALFGLLALVMVLTRRLDWARLSAERGE